MLLYASLTPEILIINKVLPQRELDLQKQSSVAKSRNHIISAQACGYSRQKVEAEIGDGASDSQNQNLGLKGSIREF